jgi:aryl-alcohol dehydrogenase-like predicted oxidoreductase
LDDSCFFHLADPFHYNYWTAISLPLPDTDPQPKINTDITTTQIALNYVVAKGGVPLVEVNNPKQAQEVIGCLGWTLTDAEVDMLELAADACRS